MALNPTEATHLVECFWPDVREAQVDEAAERIRDSLATLRADRQAVRFAGSILIPGDEVVFYLFESESTDAVREVCERAAVPLERIVDSVQHLGEGEAGGRLAVASPAEAMATRESGHAPHAAR